MSGVPTESSSLELEYLLTSWGALQSLEESELESLSSGTDLESLVDSPVLDRLSSTRTRLVSSISVVRRAREKWSEFDSVWA